MEKVKKLSLSPAVIKKVRAKYRALNKAASDPVSHPSHYTSRVPGIECIQVTEWFNFARGNAIKYIWRAGEKNPEKEVEDLEKAAWYINREIQRMKGEKTK